jgi:hypothetical protein
MPPAESMSPGIEAHPATHSRQRGMNTPITARSEELENAPLKERTIAVICGQMLIFS